MSSLPYVGQYNVLAMCILSVCYIFALYKQGLCVFRPDIMFSSTELFWARYWVKRAAYLGYDIAFKDGVTCLGVWK